MNKCKNQIKIIDLNLAPIKLEKSCIYFINELFKVITQSSFMFWLVISLGLSPLVTLSV